MEHRTHSNITVRTRVSDGIFDPLTNFHIHSGESLYSGNK